MMRDAVLSGIMGLAVGDALGVPVERMERDALSGDPVTGMRGGGTHGLPAGTWSDDTSMNLCFMDSVAALRRVDYDDIMCRFVRWMNNGEYSSRGSSFDVGNTVRAALGAYLGGTPELKCGQMAENSCGNGSLMRILPAALLAAAHCAKATGALTDDGMDLVHDASRLTHAHPVCLAGCGIYACIVSALVRGLDAAEAVAAGFAAAKAYYSCRDGYAAAFAKYADIPETAGWPEARVKSGGYVADTLHAAVWCLLNSDSYAECVLKAVNLGGDTDTVAAVAGGLAGLCYGYPAIPEEWLRALAQRDYLETLCGRYGACM